MSSFFEKYIQRRKQISSVLCVGLDPDPSQIPSGYDISDIIQASREFLQDIICATRKYALAYKANCAFFEALGVQGMLLFSEIIKLVRQEARGALFIADAKRGDVPHSAAAYAKAFFEELDCDALTLNPYMGLDCLSAFWSYSEKATMVLCYTSNPGASFFQTLGDPPLYLKVAASLAKQNESSGNLWLVVGASHEPQVLAQIRKAAPEMPLLVPGVGSQGGNLRQCLESLGNNVLINVGRSILYTSPSRAELPSLVQKECQRLQAKMQPYL